MPRKEKRFVLCVSQAGLQNKPELGPRSFDSQLMFFSVTYFNRLKFIPKYCMFLYAIVGGILKLFSISDFLLLVQY